MRGPIQSINKPVFRSKPTPSKKAAFASWAHRCKPRASESESIRANTNIWGLQLIERKHQYLRSNAGNSIFFFLFSQMFLWNAAARYVIPLVYFSPLVPWDWVAYNVFDKMSESMLCSFNFIKYSIASVFVCYVFGKGSCDDIEYLRFIAND